MCRSSFLHGMTTDIFIGFCSMPPRLVVGRLRADPRTRVRSRSYKFFPWLLALGKTPRTRTCLVGLRTQSTRKRGGELTPLLSLPIGVRLKCRLVNFLFLLPILGHAIRPCRDV